MLGPSDSLASSSLYGFLARTAQVRPAEARGSGTLLPQSLLKGTGFEVVQGTDPGNFYCEHHFFSAQQEAVRKNSSVLRNKQGEPLVGFLHVPSDKYTNDAKAIFKQQARHQHTREVVGRIVRGYVWEASAGVGHGPVRILLTGYGSWGSVTNNPTGNFVGHRENIDAVMDAAFGDRLLTPCGKSIALTGRKGADGRAYHYRVRTPGGREREVIIQAEQLPVTDKAIDRSPTSIQSAMAKFRPHAVIGLGVSSNERYLAEFHADDGGLKHEKRRGTHESGRAPVNNLAPNYSLARAILSTRR